LDRRAAEAERHIDIHRQLYNHVKYDYEHGPEDDKPSEYTQNNKLPDWKQRWPVLPELHSKAAQETVARFHDNLSSLKGKKENGGHVGRLRQARQSFGA
jgi:putative transposase